MCHGALHRDGLCMLDYAGNMSVTVATELLRRFFHSMPSSACVQASNHTFLTCDVGPRPSTKCLRRASSHSGSACSVEGPACLKGKMQLIIFTSCRLRMALIPVLTDTVEVEETFAATLDLPAGAGWSCGHSYACLVRATSSVSSGHDFLTRTRCSPVHTWPK